MNEPQISYLSVAASINVFVIFSMKHILKRIDFQAPDNYEDGINATEESQMTTLVGVDFWQWQITTWICREQAYSYTIIHSMPIERIRKYNS